MDKYGRETHEEDVAAHGEGSAAQYPRACLAHADSQLGDNCLYVQHIQPRSRCPHSTTNEPPPRSRDLLTTAAAAVSAGSSSSIRRPPPLPSANPPYRRTGRLPHDGLLPRPLSLRNPPLSTRPPAAPLLPPLIHLPALENHLGTRILGVWMAQALLALVPCLRRLARRMAC